MLWLFVILGLLTFTAAGLGFLATIRGRSMQSGLHFVGLFFVGAAWVGGHDRPAGWAALLLAAAIELIGWAGFRRPAREVQPTSLEPQDSEALLGQSQAPPSVGEEIEHRLQESLSTHSASADRGSVQAAVSSSMHGQTEKQHQRPTALPAAAGRGSDQTAAAPPIPPKRVVEFSTMALLRCAVRPTAVVFLASLRRGGQRDAKLAPGQPDGTNIRVEIRATTMEIAYTGAPADASLIDYALSQTFDWPEAGEQTAGHPAHVVLTTRAPEDFPRLEVLRLHCRAHAALAEFAPLAAIVWPDAGRLVPPTALAALAAGDPDPASTCISFRTFPLDGADAGRTLCDTAGLHGFGLPDVQVIVEGEPGESVSALLYRLAEQFFTNGCDLMEGEEIASAGSENPPRADPPSAEWTVHFTRGRFPPDRKVIELTRLDP